MLTRLTGGLAAAALLAGALACQSPATAADPTGYPQALGFTTQQVMPTADAVYVTGVADDNSAGYLSKVGGEPLTLDTGSATEVYTVNVAQRVDGTLYVIASTDTGYDAFFVDPATMVATPNDVPPGWSNVDALGTDAAGPFESIRSADQQVVLSAGGLGEPTLDSSGTGTAVAATGEMGSRDWYVAGTHWSGADGSVSTATLWSYDEATHTAGTPVVLGPDGDPDESVIDVVADPATGTVYVTSFQNQPDGNPQTYGISVVHDGVATYHPLESSAQQLALSPDGQTVYVSGMAGVTALDADHIVDNADTADDARSVWIDAGVIRSVTTDPAGNLFVAADQSVLAYSAPAAPTGLDLAVDAAWPEYGDLTWTAPEATGGASADSLSYVVTLTDKAGGEPQTTRYYGTEMGVDLVAGHSYDISVATDNGLFRSAPVTMAYTPAPVMGHPSAVSVAGPAKVGSRLTVANTGGWAKGATLTYEWIVDDASVSTGSSLTVTPEMLGKQVMVAVTGHLAGFGDHTEWSRPTGKVVRGSLTGAKPRLSGSAQVGKSLKAKAGTWTAGTDLSYSWAANGKKIAGASRATLKLAKAQAGKRITVTVTGTRPGYAPLSKASAATDKVAR